MSLDRSPALGVWWGKSDAGGRPNLLLQHLLDTAAVAELLWDRYLAPGTRSWLNAVSGGAGRTFFALVAGLHDVGKATPAFQAKVDGLARKVRAVGLDWRRLDAESARWHHSVAGAFLLRSVLPAFGWSASTVAWVWPLVAGHHGLVPDAEKLLAGRRLGNAQGRGESWRVAQAALVQAVADELKVDLTELGAVVAPRRGQQLSLSGLVIMADWIASGMPFAGVDVLGEVSMEAARRRALAAWDVLELRGGWGAAPYQHVEDLVAARFGKPSRPLQVAGVELAEGMPGPGLLIVEAPMGEGKTEVALAAAEVLGRRFGCDGVFVGMPTQATSDPMFERVVEWAGAVDTGLPVGLLHGKRMFNRRWNEMQQCVHFAGVDEFGCDDEYAVSDGGRWERPEHAPAEWFLGPKRGMLMPVVVGTIDQLLHAATRTKHVMLRHAGLNGRVVILDEVHAYDVYMSQFLFEALRWLADAGVPVILLSATLPPGQRHDLMRAYLQGATGQRVVDLSVVSEAEGYPVFHALSVVGGTARRDVRTSVPWRRAEQVRLRILEEAPEDGAEQVVGLLDEQLRDGGCALVIRNTVSRAQQTYEALVGRWGSGQVLLLHARLTVAERAERTRRALELLGPPGGPVQRPKRLIVVATQLAEQSFDVDADLLVTDLAPIDLLLQRIGRVHRHTRPVRPAGLHPPQVFVAGVHTVADGPPAFPSGSMYIYGRHLLLRSAALVLEGVDGRGWSIPTDVPDLVSRGYGDSEPVPASWGDSAESARRVWETSERARQDIARSFLLAGEDTLGTPTLAGLHGRATGDLPDDDAVAAVVRDGTESVEVVLVRQDEGRYLTLGGHSLGPNGDASDADIVEEVAGSMVRLPPRPNLTAAAKAELGPLPGWYGNPWLQRCRALVLDANNSTVLAGRRLTYKHDLGLVDASA
ncbi:CRISPR-associated helicase Cas3' [Micromonospora sp. NPDC049903]|uniref:CRISPR-associated helicase Cas3' n=1 Tax=Micromonospora sp. NPDC049903 TaxID=3364276 RepID=UPI0037ADFC01